MSICQKILGNSFKLEGLNYSENSSGKALIQCRIIVNPYSLSREGEGVYLLHFTNIFKRKISLLTRSRLAMDRCCR